jgi:hypothetical protein
MKYDVYISYSNKDKIIADDICEFLERQKIICWYAPRNLTPGNIFQVEISKAIKNSRVFILVFSKYSNLSEGILNEIEIAFKSKKILIPFRIDNINYSDDIRYYFKSAQWIDAHTTPMSAHIETLGLTINKLLNNSTSEIEATSSDKVYYNKKSKKQVFISYKSKNHKVARYISEALQSVGCKIWHAEYSILEKKKNEEIESILKNGTESADFAICLTNEDYSKSEWCYDKELIPLVRENWQREQYF